MKIIRGRSIQTKFLVFFGISAIALFGTVGFIFFRSTQLAINTSKENEFGILSQETSNKIERFLFERYGDIQVMASSPLLKDKSLNPMIKQEYIENVRLAYKTYDYILTTDKDGNIDTFTGELKGDESYKQCFQKILSGQIYVSDFTYSKDFKGYAIYFSAPIKDNNGKIIGAVIERMNFDSINEIVKKVKLGNHGYAYLVKSNGNAINYPFGEKISYADFGKNNNGILYPKHNNTTYMLSYNIIQGYGDKWYLVVEEPMQEAFQLTNTIRDYTLLVILIAVIVILTVAAIMSRKITNPIRKLLLETQDIAEGRLSKNVEIMTEDEVGKLAESFNAILDNLKAMMQQVLEVSGETALLNEVRQYAEKFFDEVPSAIIIIDSIGVITNFNNIAADIFSINPDDIIGKSITEFEDTNLEPLIKLLKNGLENEVIYIKHVLKIVTRDNIEVPIIINTSVQKDNSDNIIGLICVFKNMKEIKAFEESVIRAKNLESLGALAAGMAHEIRNPLTSIKGYAQYLKLEVEGNKELDDDVTIIISEVDRLNDIINRFLTFARPQELKLELTDINDIVKDVVNLIQKDVTANNIDIIQTLGKSTNAYVDYSQIQQVILNITINAIQAMPDGGSLTISTSYLENQHYVEISIKDTGEGIKPEDYDKIFEPFFTTKQKGTGLGLAICSRIIENHKGIIEVSSTVATGTKVTIKLPEKTTNS